MISDDLAWLVARHPKLFRGSPPRTASWLPAGWRELADQLFADIEAASGTATDAVRVDQIKEKFGALRLYVDVGDDAPPGLRSRLRALIDAAEATSQTICDVCGAPGLLIKGDGRVRTACVNHGTGTTLPTG